MRIEAAVPGADERLLADKDRPNSPKASRNMEMAQLEAATTTATTAPPSSLTSPADGVHVPTTWQKVAVTGTVDAYWWNVKTRETSWTPPVAPIMDLQQQQSNEAAVAASSENVNGIHECGDCNKTFASTSNLERHKKQHCTFARANQVADSFECNGCGTIFNRNGNLERHMNHHCSGRTVVMNHNLAFTAPRDHNTSAAHASPDSVACLPR